jgi:hypothetical protein
VVLLVELTSEQVAAVVHEEVSAVLAEFLPQTGENDRETAALRTASRVAARIVNDHANNA